MYLFLFLTFWTFFLLQKVAHPLEYLLIPVWGLLFIVKWGDNG